MSSLKLLLLGPPRLERANVPVELERRKALALLAFLAVSGEAQPRETLAALFWPDHDDSQAHAYLRRALWTVKQALGEKQVAIGRERVGLAASPAALADPMQLFWLDVAHFRQLLAGCGTHGHPPNEICPACLPLLAEALAQVEKKGERFWEAELYRLKGELLLQDRKVGGGGKDENEAEQWLWQAIEVARRQGPSRWNCGQQ